jgi:hypothetical protein
VVSEILELHARGASVAYSKVPSALTSAAARCLGGWQSAIEAAGLNYDEVRLQRAPYTPEEITSLLQRLAEARPRMLWGELYEHAATEAMARCFGSVRAAVQASGVVGWPLVGQGRAKALCARYARPSADARVPSRRASARRPAGTPVVPRRHGERPVYRSCGDRGLARA